MLPENDTSYIKLSQNTLNKIENCFKNCNGNDISDHLFNVLFDASDIRNEINKDDIFRLGFKFLNKYLNEKGE